MGSEKCNAHHECPLNILGPKQQLPQAEPLCFHCTMKYSTIVLLTGSSHHSHFTLGGEKSPPNPQSHSPLSKMSITLGIHYMDLNEELYKCNTLQYFLNRFDDYA